MRTRAEDARGVQENHQPDEPGHEDRPDDHGPSGGPARRSVLGAAVGLASAGWAGCIGHVLLLALGGFTSSDRSIEPLDVIET
jgi:hypothetical protein